MKSRRMPPEDIMRQARELEEMGGDPDLMVWSDPRAGMSRATWRDYGLDGYPGTKKRIAGAAATWILKEDEMNELETLIVILEKSVEKNGEIQLTNKHLLNILKMVKRKIEHDDFIGDLIEAQADVH